MRQKERSAYSFFWKRFWGNLAWKGWPWREKWWGL